MEEKDWLPDELLTVRNLTLIADVLINVNKRELLPSILELMLLQIQDIVDENCIVEVEDRLRPGRD